MCEKNEGSPSPLRPNKQPFLECNPFDQSSANVHSIRTLVKSHIQARPEEEEREYEHSLTYHDSPVPFPMNLIIKFKRSSTPSLSHSRHSGTRWRQIPIQMLVSGMRLDLGRLEGRHGRHCRQDQVCDVVEGKQTES